MTNYLIRRAFQMMIVVLLATFAIYLLLNIAPGGPLAGLKLAADVKSRVSEADIARLEAYLGLDKPLAMRYLLWLIGDDWLGSDWVYAGLTQFRTPKLGRDGTPIIKIDRSTGEQYFEYEKHRFWADPGIALLNPGYPVWVYGEQVAPGEYTATDVVVKPPLGMDPPSEVVLTGKVLEQEGYNFTVESLSGNLSTVSTSEDPPRLPRTLCNKRRVTARGSSSSSAIAEAMVPISTIRDVLSISRRCLSSSCWAFNITVTSRATPITPVTSPSLSRSGE